MTGRHHAGSRRARRRPRPRPGAENHPGLRLAHRLDRDDAPRGRERVGRRGASRFFRSWARLAAALALTLAAPAIPAQAGEAGELEAAVEQVLRDIEAAYRAGDDRYLALYDENALVLFGGQPPIRGPAEIGRWWRDFNAEWRAEVTLTNVEITVSGDRAYAINETRAELTSRADGQRETRRGRNLLVLARQPDGSWKLSRVFTQAAPDAP